MYHIPCIIIFYHTHCIINHYHTLYHPLSHPISSIFTRIIALYHHPLQYPVSSSFITPCIINPITFCIILYHILHYHILSHAVSSMHGKICITSHIKPRPISDTVFEILTDMVCDINFVMPT